MALGAILALIARLSLLTMFVMTTVTGVVSGVTRAAQYPLPPLLYANNSRLYLFETNCADWLAICAGRDRMLLENLNQGWPVAQWSPDGAFIAVYTNDGWMIYRAECLLDGGECEPVALDPLSTDTRLAWRSDGSALAYRVGQSDSSLRIRSEGCWNLDRVEVCLEQTIPVGSGMLIPWDWSTEGNVIVLTSFNEDVYLLDLSCVEAMDTCWNNFTQVATGNMREGFPSLSNKGISVLFAAYSMPPNPVEQLHLIDVGTRQRRQLTFRDADSTQPDWSADDRYIAYAGFAEDGVGLLDVYVLDLPRGIHVRLVRNPDRDMFPNWGPLPQ